MQLLTEKRTERSGRFRVLGRQLPVGRHAGQRRLFAEIITLDARLVPPGGGAPIRIAVSGSRTNVSEVINRLADKVMESLKLGQSRALLRNARDEAGQFYNGAQWAMQWELYPQAQAAAESAWALGKHDADTAILRVRTYSESIRFIRRLNKYML